MKDLLRKLGEMSDALSLDSGIKTLQFETSSDHKLLIAARSELNRRAVPASNRSFIAHTEVVKKLTGQYREAFKTESLPLRMLGFNFIVLDKKFFPEGYAGFAVSFDPNSETINPYSVVGIKELESADV